MHLLVLLSDPERAATFPDGPDLTRYFLACGGLLLLVLLVAYGFKRGFAKTLAARAARRSLRIVDVLPLGGSKRLVVVNCYDRVFLVGQGEKELCRIAELDSDEVSGPPREEGEVQEEPPVPAEFSEAFVEAGGPPVIPAPRRSVLQDGRGILG